MCSDAVQISIRLMIQRHFHGIDYMLNKNTPPPPSFPQISLSNTSVLLRDRGWTTEFSLFGLWIDMRCEYKP